MGWFAFPRGSSAISVEQQNFQPEYEMPDGTMLFRAPDHFAPCILDLPGFRAVPAPEDAPVDTTTPDTLRDGAIVELSDKLRGYESEINALRQEHNTLLGQFQRVQGELTAAWQERDALRVERDGLSADLLDAREQLQAQAAQKKRP